MSDSAVTEFTSVQSQYEAQVAADLENNTAERKRLRSEIEELQAKLETLEHDHTLLLGVQGVFTGGSGAGSARGAKVPGARVPKRAAKSSAASAPKSAKTSKTSAKARSGSKGSAKPATGAAGKQPSLAQLVSTLLAAHGEPRSAAEISAELAADHPSRNSNINVVRNALELLVAKSEAHRAKQQKSVFYTHAGQDGAAVPAPDADATPAAG
ncbi:hypothetical protein OIE71_01420 [Streptomyces sp. NBC_01725]|uniref:hypothetical protein n=1 Tax=Streptomyces sp. NBC_01725 TaxID=2975923 RepID=UPI002E27C495|nr:hypothetical protein [Streptomyces sp. NBC_01725]